MSNDMTPEERARDAVRFKWMDRDDLANIIANRIREAEQAAFERGRQQGAAEEREACAAIADKHKGAAAKKRRTTGKKLSGFPDMAQLEIQSEERGEDIASETIAAAIRARKEGDS